MNRVVIILPDMTNYEKVYLNSSYSVEQDKKKLLVRKRFFIDF